MKELSDFAKKTELRQIMADLGSNSHELTTDEVTQGTDHQEIYTLIIPKDTETLCQTTSIVYKGKLLIREIALFAGAQSSSFLFVFIAGLLRFSIPFLVRYYEFGSPIYNF